MIKWIKTQIKNYFKIKELRTRIAPLSICYLTGAGISVPSGISPFRGSGGIYSNMPDLIYKLRPDTFETDPQFLYDFHEDFKNSLVDKYPNLIHELITQSAQAVITQNIDDLHEKSGFYNVIHVHGSVHDYKCRSCGFESRGSFKINDNCKECGEQRLRHNVVLFKESIIRQSEAKSALKKAQVLISIGTSGSVYPVAGYPDSFEGIRICINNKLPDNHYMFDVVLIGNSEKILKQLLKNYHK